ncbi:hypothetical protein EOB77_34955 [Mesorhizobium sp. M7A.F.Ca.MR.228.00.0.0]|nr:hypothetical protein EOB77_34955 [Mesorhizobium sp. M7A.F.Ca.MR.228.00.0.0]
MLEVHDAAIPDLHEILVRLVAVEADAGVPEAGGNRKLRVLIDAIADGFDGNDQLVLVAH